MLRRRRVLGNMAAGAGLYGVAVSGTVLMLVVLFLFDRIERWARVRLGLPKHEDDLIIPAREGALRVLRAARDAGVQRVVMTSSFAAIGYGHPTDPGRPYTEEDWTDPDGPHVTPYAKSKTLAERAAWEFIDR